MVFANLQEKEKDAFFSLLDEYFQSRPEIFTALSSSGQKGNNTNNPFNSAAALAASNSALGQRAISAAPAAASAAASSFAKRNFGPSGGGSGGGTDTSTAQESSQHVAGRVAAAAAAFSQHQHQRGASASPATTGSTSNRLSSVDTSSLKSVFANRASASTMPSFHKAAPPAVKTPPQPEPELEDEDEGGEGQWGEALYDYVSDEPGDLNIRENQKIWVTQRNSDDWWTGEVDGKSGLFPASYVELL
ncbi:SH3 domain containing protein [Amanita muscaria]